ncbi:MAG: hypothetical protein ACPGVU_21080 [Limisphaerales bacterium]
MKRIAAFLSVLLFAFDGSAALRAGVAKVDVTRESARTGDPSYAKALVLSDGETTAVIVSIDVVAIGEIGSIKNDFLPNVRTRVKQELGIEPKNVLMNASHCHSVISGNIEELTFQAIAQAAKNMVPVKAGVGTGSENRVQENRRIVMKNGTQIDVRHAYALPPDEQMAAVGPVDTEIGILKLDRVNGTPFALVYNFACHPIQGIPSGGNTADMSGFASQVIEDNLGHGAIALFVQGCGGDINPLAYKHIGTPHDAEPLGNLLGLSTLKAARQIKTKANAGLRMLNHTIGVPRANHSKRLTAMEAEQAQLLKNLRGTSLNLRTFLNLRTRYGLSGEFPSEYAYRYLRDEQIGRDNLKKLDERNKADMERYLRNIHTMESLSRLLINKALLEKHHARNSDAKFKPLDVEVVGLRVGDFRLVTFPGEVTVPIGLNLKKASPFENTFVAGYSNGYIYYCPTAEQLKNVGRAQEDSDCLLAPEWQAMFEKKALEILNAL